MKVDFKRCPACGGCWCEDIEMPEYMHRENSAKYPTLESAQEAARDHGWTPENKLKPHVNVIGQQYPHSHPEYYDGVSVWHCTMCRARIGRWSGKVLKDGEVEKRLGLDESQEG